MKDADRQLVYDAETAAFEGSTFEEPIQFDALLSLAQLVRTSELWFVEAGGRSVVVEKGRTTRRHSVADISKGLVVLAAAQFTIATLAHEMAHIAAGPTVPGHGSRFRALYIGILRSMGANDAAERLAHQFKIRRLFVDDLSVEIAADRSIARKVAALLDKAASTSFTAEGEALTAKAMELMARHQLDEALVSRLRNGGVTHDNTIIERELFFSAGPFIGTRTELLNAVARANGCRLIFRSSDAGRVLTVIGLRTDVATTLSMFTMLSAHSVNEMLMAKPVGNTVAFRRSFLLGYAVRTAERFDAARQQAVDDITREHGSAEASAALVLLKERQTLVESYMRREHRGLRNHYTGGGSTWSGYDAGTSAADRAPLGNASINTRRALPSGR